MSEPKHPLLSVDQAITAILARVQPLPACRIELADALGLTLAEPIASDIDLPPFDKALMDGYAVRSFDFAGSSPQSFRISEEILAGGTPRHPLKPGEAARIMTGAPLPPGADAVVMVERSTLLDEATVSLDGPVRPGLNRLTRGAELKADELLLSSGTRLGPAQLGLIASAGRAQIEAVPRPRVVVVPTGDELVPPSEVPGLGQIRNSNGVMLASLARSWGASQVRERPIAPDDPEGLRSSLLKAIGAADVVLISGGVSAGTRDLVPSTLVDLGVEPVFHRVNVKPGKPLWFGVSRDLNSGALIFGLPGNPVSGLVGFLLFVKPAMEALAGRSATRSELESLPLLAPFHHSGDRPTYHPARIDRNRNRIALLRWAGSSDLRTVAMAEGFAVFPEGEWTYQAGDLARFLPISEKRE